MDEINKRPKKTCYFSHYIDGKKIDTLLFTRRKMIAKGDFYKDKQHKADQIRMVIANYKNIIAKLENDLRNCHREQNYILDDYLNLYAIFKQTKEDIIRKNQARKKRIKED